MARWLHALQQFQFSIVHRPGRDHGDGLSRVPSSPCRQCTRPDCPPAIEVTECADQPFDSESTGSSEDTDLIPIHSGEDWVALLDDDLSQPSAIAGDSFRISALQKEDLVCITLSSWISSGLFPTWTEVRRLCPELRLLWHHRNNFTVDDNGIIWRKRSTQSPVMQLLVPKPGRKQIFQWLHGSRLRNKYWDTRWDHHPLSPPPFTLEFRIACDLLPLPVIYIDHDIFSPYSRLRHYNLYSRKI